jgi:hypothetical protein
MTLARRLPMKKEPIKVVEPAVSLSITPAEAVASDDLTTQH